MGVDARIVVYAPTQEAAERACTAAFARIAELDSIMSDYRVDSELNRLAAQAGGPPVKVSRDLFLVLQRAQQVSAASAGAFDITVSPLVRLWREARKAKRLPAEADIQAARRFVGWNFMSLDPLGLRVRLAKPGMRLDLGGIAKGYAADEALVVLGKHGIQRALIELGGDIRLGEAPPNAKGWVVRVTVADRRQGERFEDLELANCGVSTSGDTEQFFESGGKRYSHVVDPRTGWALTSRRQATVIAPDAFTSDPLSTALTVAQGRDQKRLLASFPQAKAMIRVAR